MSDSYLNLSVTKDALIDKRVDDGQHFMQDLLAETPDQVCKIILRQLLKLGVNVSKLSVMSWHLKNNSANHWIWFPDSKWGVWI